MSKAALWNASPGCAAFSGVRIFILWQCFVRLQSRPVADVGCWWMVSVDGALHGVVWYSCWQVYGTETASLLGKDALLLHTFTGTSLACYKLVCFWWLCMLSFLSFFVFGRERVSQARRCRRCGKTSSIQADKQRMPLKMKATCKHMLASRWKQPATHACKQVFTNTRQQATKSDNKKTKNQVKNNRWIL